MRIVFSLVTAAVLTIASFNPSPAKAEMIGNTPVYESYEDLREIFIAHLLRRDIKLALEAAVGTKMAKPQQLYSIENQIKAARPNNFKQYSTISHTILENGWGEEVIGLWVGASYLFAQITYHTRDEGTIILNAAVNTDPRKIAPLF